MSTVLVIEDSPRVLPLIVHILEEAGFSVLAAANCAQAMDIAGEADAVLTDISLPDGSGFQLAEKMRAIRPHLKVLFMSGFDLQVPSGYEFIAKPFQPDELVARIQSLLHPPA